MNLVEAQPGSASGQRNEYEYFTIIETSYTTSATALSFSALIHEKHAHLLEDLLVNPKVMIVLQAVKHTVDTSDPGVRASTENKHPFQLE